MSKRQSIVDHANNDGEIESKVKDETGQGSLLVDIFEDPITRSKSQKMDPKEDSEVDKATDKPSQVLNEELKGDYSSVDLRAINISFNQ